AVADDAARGPARPLLRHRLRLPDALTALRDETAELAVAADAVDVVADDHRGGGGRVQPVGLNLALALSLPDHRRRRLLVVELQHQRTVVEVGEEQHVAAEHRRRDGHRRADLVRLLPVLLAGLGIERHDRAGIPDDQLPRAAARGDDDRLADPELGVRRQRAPDDPAKPAVAGVRHSAFRPSEGNASMVPASFQTPARPLPRISSQSSARMAMVPIVVRIATVITVRDDRRTSPPWMI